MNGLLPHLRRELESLRHLADRYRAEDSAFADLVDGDVAALAERVVEAENEEREKS